MAASRHVRQKFEPSVYGIDVRNQTASTPCIHLNHYYYYYYVYFLIFYNHFRDNEAELVIYEVVVIIIILHNS